MIFVFSSDVFNSDSCTLSLFCVFGHYVVKIKILLSQDVLFVDEI